MDFSRTLFGDHSRITSRRAYESLDDSFDASHHEDDEIHKPPSTAWERPFRFLFGFMYEEDYWEQNISSDDILYRSTIDSSTSLCNRLNAALCSQLFLVSFATAVPIPLVSQLSQELEPIDSWSPRATAAAVMGVSFGKFLNGPIGDLFGARRTLLCYAVLLALALLFLATVQSMSAAIGALFWIEFFASVQWPCCLVILATHYRGNASGAYEGGIYVTSLASRLGSLSGLLWFGGGRWMALVGAWMALVACSICFFYVADSPEHVHEPQNPMDPGLWQKWYPEYYYRRRNLSLGMVLRMIPFVIRTNLVPSIQHVCQSGIFWVVAVAHTGSSMVKTSERVLASYLVATSNGATDESQASTMAVFLSLGTVAGLVVAGNLFASRQERERKWLVGRLYLATICCCYLLAFLSIPRIRNLVASPDLIQTFQVMAISVAGFGIAVPMYHIPSLVGATFGCDKGLYSAYTDGVAYGLASLLWRFVADAVQQGNAEGGGWAYGWAAVALMVVVSALLMLEFMEHYFCRGANGVYETIIFA